MNDGPGRRSGPTGALSPELAALVERYAPLTHRSPFGMALLELDGRYVAVNDTLCRILGRPEAELLTTTWRALVHPDDVGEAMGFVERVAAGDLRPFSTERRYIHAEGHVVRVLLGISPLEGADGRAIGYFTTAYDVTEHRRLAGHVQLLKDVAVASNEATSVEHAMHRALELICAHTGWAVGHLYTVDPNRPEDVLPSHVWHLDDPPRFQRLVEVTQRRPFRSGTGLPGRVVATGQVQWVADIGADPEPMGARVVPEAGLRSAFAVPVVVRNEVVAVLEFFATEVFKPDDALLDVMPHVGAQLGRVVERWRAERALGAAFEREHEDAERLRELDELKNTFLRAVSHDLRSPIASVVGLADLLVRHADKLSPDDRIEIASRISGSGQKLGRMLDDLLDLERIRRGVIETRRERVDLAALVRAVVAETVEAARVAISVEAEEVEAYTDPGKVERIVENLVTNAARHTPAGTAVWVWLRARRADIEITVEDEGPGVPDEMKRTLFDPFVKGSSTGGIGVGLSLVGRFAELLGGRAWVEDRAGGGASFKVRLPGSVARGRATG